MKKNNYRGNKGNKKQALHRINDNIRNEDVRLTGDNIPESGQVVSLKIAMNLANELNLDLVEINGNSLPPICKILDYKKFLYEEKKNKKEREKKQKQTNKDLKEIQFRPNIGDADITVKKKKIIGFLEKGHKVKISMRFRGREIQNSKDKGELIMLSLADELANIAKIESMPSLTKLLMTMMMSPKK